MTPARRWTPLLTALVAVLIGLVLAGAVFVVDRYAASRAEDAVARQVQAELQTPAVPRVSIRDFPFLTQLLTGRWSEVRVVAEDVLLPGGDSLPVRGLDLVLSGVTGEDDYARVRAAHVEGTAILNYGSLPRMGGQPLTYGGAGRVSVDLLPALAGVPLEATVVGRPVLDVDRQTITLAEPRIVVAGMRVREELARPILRALLRPIPVTGVPLGLRLTSLAVDGTGVQVGLVGDDVALRG